MRGLLAALFIIVLLMGGYYVSQTPDALQKIMVFLDIGEEQQSKQPQSSQVFISVIESPITAQGSEPFSVAWRISSPSGFATTDTRIYFGPVPHPGRLATSANPADVGYASYTPAQTGSIPADFRTDVTPGPDGGITYFRVYCMAEGLNYWSNEYPVNVTAVEEPPADFIPQ